MGSKVKLDVDPSIIENKLRIKEIDKEEEDFNNFFNSIQTPKQSGVGDGIPWKLVTPSPGMCVKFFTAEGDKSFVNICHTREIPPPKEIADKELITILESEDPSSYRMPMSISDPHTEADKSGNLTLAYDVAVNSSLIHKIENNKLFQVFFMTILLEALQDKYKIKVNMTSQTPYIILKNRKVLGSLRPHRIQQRDVKPPPSPLIEEVSSPKSESSASNTLRDPKLKLERYPAEGDPEYLIARVRIKTLSENDVLLDVGEDRLVLTAAKRQQSFVDIFLPYNIIQEKTTAEYSRIAQELKIHMPVVQ
uniref:PIH1 domain-containing protein 1 n=1 Tax=Riptortus pedestris TaxID=329032 RepID=R4WTG2_RIPPE|nr:conserved hypothetical protein [Riptortus pedestris]